MREEYKSLYRGQQIDAATAAFLSGTLATREELKGKVDKVSGKGLSENDFTDADKQLLQSLSAGSVASVNGQTGVVVITASDVGLGSVDNTPDSAKIVSIPQQSALDLKVDKVVGKGLSENDFTDAFETKLTGIETGAQVNTVTSVATKTGAVTLVKADVGLDLVDNTSDLAKPVSTATQTALNGKVDTVVGKGLSDENYTLTEKNKLAGIESGAEVNTVDSVAGKTGIVTLVKADVGLDQVDNNSDLAKPVSTATQNALDLKSNLSSAMGFINHGAVAGTARPASYASVTWLGSVEPTNATNDDIWIDTSA